MGVAVFNRLAHHAQKAGNDPTGMGRWSWIRLQGKGNHITQVVALYRLCSLDDPLLTYQQHCCGLAKLGQNACPRKAILSDLESELISWQEAGDMIIVLTDFNDDV